MQRRQAKAVGWIGVGLHLAVGFLYLTTPLLAPPGAVLTLWAIWSLLFAAALRWRTPKPSFALAVPFAAAAAWF